MKLEKITIRTDNTEKGVARIGELNNSVLSKELDLISEGNTSVVTYSNYESNDKGMYDYTISDYTVEDRDKLLHKLREDINYKEYTLNASTPVDSIQNTWKEVWSADINRAFSIDYEFTLFDNETNTFNTHVFIALKPNNTDDKFVVPAPAFQYK